MGWLVPVDSSSLLCLPPTFLSLMEHIDPASEKEKEKERKRKAFPFLKTRASMILYRTHLLRLVCPEPYSAPASFHPQMLALYWVVQELAHGRSVHGLEPSFSTNHSPPRHEVVTPSTNYAVRAKYEGWMMWW